MKGARRSPFRPVSEIYLTSEAITNSWLKRRRAEKLERELAILRQMDSQLWRKVVICGSLSIVGIAAMIFAVGYFGHVHLELPRAIFLSLGIGAIVYWANHYEYGLLRLSFFLLMAILLLGMIFGDVPPIDLPNYESRELKLKPDRKAERQAKLERAIARRKARLEELLRQL